MSVNLRPSPLEGVAVQEIKLLHSCRHGSEKVIRPNDVTPARMRGAVHDSRARTVIFVRAGQAEKGAKIFETLFGIVDKCLVAQVENILRRMALDIFNRLTK